MYQVFINSTTTLTFRTDFEANFLDNGKSSGTEIANAQQCACSLEGLRFVLELLRSSRPLVLSLSRRHISKASILLIVFCVVCAPLVVEKSARKSIPAGQRVSYLAYLVYVRTIRTVHKYIPVYTCTRYVRGGTSGTRIYGR